jgi:hypothetical protein
MAAKVPADGLSLSAMLQTRLQSRAIVLDDRRVPGVHRPIDHIVVAPSGVWVVDANDNDGRVERRDVGGWFKVDERLYVGGKDHSHLVDDVDRSVIAVEEMLASAGLGSVPVHAALCFINTTWGWFPKPFALAGVWVAWPDKLTDLVLDWTAIPEADFDRLARVVAGRLLSTN